MTVDFKELFRNISVKNVIYIFGVMGIILIFIASIMDSDTKEPAVMEEADYCSSIEARLEKILPEIAAVGKVSVMVTAKNYGSITLAKDKEGEEEQIVILNQKGGGESPLVMEETLPIVQGVIIVAEGGGSDLIKAQLTEAVVALLEVDAHRVKIFERKVR